MNIMCIFLYKKAIRFYPDFLLRNLVDFCFFTVYYKKNAYFLISKSEGSNESNYRR